MNKEKFEDILSWQNTKELTIDVYSEFEHNKDYGFNNQIQRAYVSIMNNIAEGFERKSNKEVICFSFIAQSSWREYLGIELKYISKKTFIK